MTTLAALLALAVGGPMDVELKTDYDLSLDLPLSLSEAPRVEGGTDIDLPESVAEAWVPPQMAGTDWTKVMLAYWIGARLGVGMTDNADAGFYFGVYARINILFWLSAEACLDYWFDSFGNNDFNHIVLAFHALFHPFKFDIVRPYFLMGFGIHIVTGAVDDVFGNFNVGVGTEIHIQDRLAIDTGFRFGLVDAEYFMFFVGILYRLQS